jgi:hypothetical protein
MFHCEQPTGRIIPSAKCTNCCCFIPQSKTPLIRVPSPSYLVPTSRGPGIDYWPDHVNQFCRSRSAELPSHCSRFFTIAHVANLSIYSTFHFTNFEDLLRWVISQIAQSPLRAPNASKSHSLTIHFE